MLAVATKVTKKRLNTDGDVTATNGVARERMCADSHVRPAACVRNKRVIPQDSVVVCQTTFLTNGLRLRRKRKTGEGEWNQ